MSRQVSKTLWSPWGIFGALIALMWTFTTLSMFAATPPDRPGAITMGLFLASGLVSLVIAIRAALLRTRVQPGLVVHFGMWRREEFAALDARPEVIDEKLPFYVWAPVVTPPTGGERVLSGLAGYSLSEARPNRRVAKACTIINSQGPQLAE